MTQKKLIVSVYVLCVRLLRCYCNGAEFEIL